MIKQRGLAALVERNLLNLEAVRLGITAEIEQSADTKMNLFLNRYSTQETKDKFFARTGATERQLREQYVEQLTRAKVERESGFIKPKPSNARKVPSMPIPNRPGGGMVMIEQVVISSEANAGSDRELKIRAEEIRGLWQAGKWNPRSNPDKETAEVSHKVSIFPQKKPPEPLKAQV